MCLAIPGQIVAITSGQDESSEDPEAKRGIIDIEGVRREISLALLGFAGEGNPDGVGVGDWVLCHVGFAMAKIDEKEAAETLAIIKQLDFGYQEEVEQMKASNV